MMAVLVITFVAMLLVITAMSVGVIMGRKPLTGSCGGVGAALGEKDYVCDICGGDTAKCEQISQQAVTAGKNTVAELTKDLAYNADKS